MRLPDDGLILVLKRDCPTCVMVAPLAADLRRRGLLVGLVSQDDATFPDGAEVIDDRSLEASFHLDVEIVPTLIRRERGRETGRAIGWHRDEWQALLGLNRLAPDLPATRPGCGSLSVATGMAEELVARFGDPGLASRRVAVAPPDDDAEALFDRGWTDGLPVVTPTLPRVLRMLQGTTRDRTMVVGEVPPSSAPCTVEKAAIGAVMAGCRPEYFPVVLAALDAALDPAFAWNGLLSTTMGAGVVVVVNGPISRKIGLNSGFNALGHGSRANATIARALQLIAHNIGGAHPGGIDRSTVGHPGKRGLCFAEDESDPGWQPLATSLGCRPGASAVTVLANCGTWIGSVEQARTATDLTAGLADFLRRHDPDLASGGMGLTMVLAGEFGRIYHEAGWTRERLGEALVAGLGGTGPWRDWAASGRLTLVRAGSNAGLFATLIQGWMIGPRGTQPVTREVTP